MLRTHVLPWLAALGLTLGGSQTSFAQHGRSHSHVSPGHATVNHAPSHVGGVQHGGVHVGSPAWHHGGDFRHGSFYGSWGYYPRYYGYPGYYGSWGYPSYYGSYGGYLSAPVYPYYDYSYYAVPTTTVVTTPAAVPLTPAPVGTPAHLEVIVPDPDAMVWFNGQPTTTRGTVREFDSPALEPGKTYEYSVRAVWNDRGRAASSERVVSVTAGSQVVVDFTK